MSQRWSTRRRVVHEVVVVQVREERRAHVHGAAAALDQPVMGAGTVVENERFAANLDEVAGALALERRRRRAGSEQGYTHG